MTTILFLMFIALALYCWLSLRRVSKHDRVLFPLCQLRRDLMRFLRVNATANKNALSTAEYDSIARLSDTLDLAIHDYNKHKTMMFNLRNLMKLIKAHKKTLKKAKPIDLTDNPEIQTFHSRFIRCLAEAFIAYTPLIRSELVLRMFMWTSRAVSKRVRQEALAVGKQVRAAVRSENTVDGTAAV